MGKKQEFLSKIKNHIAEQEKNISPKDYRFYLVDRFIKLTSHIDKNSENCVECNGFKKEIEEVSANLADYINRSKTNKIKYETLNDKLLYHLNKVHGLKQKRYYTSLYSVFGIAAGALTGIITSFFVYGSISKIILLFLLIGFLTGNYLGYIKDKKLKKKNLQL